MKFRREYTTLFAAALFLCGGCLSVPENAPLTAKEAAKRVPAAVAEAQSAELLRRAAGEYFSGRDQVTLSDLTAAVRSDPVNSAELARMELQKSADTLMLAFPPPGITPTEYARSRIGTRIECALRIAIAEYHCLSHLISPSPEQEERLTCVRLELAQYLGCAPAELPELLPDELPAELPPLPPLPERWKKICSDEVTATLSLAGVLLKLPAELNRLRASGTAIDSRLTVRKALALAAHFRLRLDRFALTGLALREMDGETAFLRRKFQAYELFDRAELAEFSGDFPDQEKLLFDLVQLQNPQ